jgi:hypothetical protein
MENMHFFNFAFNESFLFLFYIHVEGFILMYNVILILKALGFLVCTVLWKIQHIQLRRWTLKTI